MSDQTITSLIEKLEGAEVGSRELDYQVFLHTAPMEVASRWSPTGRMTFFTTSLDAALALAERLGHDVFGMMADVIERLERDGWSGFPAPGLQSALARYFCAALLRAQSEARV